MIPAALTALCAALLVLMVARESRGTYRPSFASMVRHQRKHFRSTSSVSIGVE